jgi:hypothetical protein
MNDQVTKTPSLGPSDGEVSVSVLETTQGHIAMVDSKRESGNQIVYSVDQILDNTACDLMDYARILRDIPEGVWGLDPQLFKEFAHEINKARATLDAIARTYYLEFTPRHEPS